MNAPSAPPLPTVAMLCCQAYPLFNPAVKTIIGGMETRAALFARGLASSGRWQVQMIVNDAGQPSAIRHEGIDFLIYQPLYRYAAKKVYPRFRKRRWLPSLYWDTRDIDLIWLVPLVAVYRFLPALVFPLFWQRHNPDIVCCFGNNSQSAEVIADCYKLGIKTVLCIAADNDISADYRPDDKTPNDYLTPKWMAHYALENADHIIVQTDTQRRALEQLFGRTGTVIRNPVKVSPADPVSWASHFDRQFVLWIGRSDTFHKRPLLFLELAQRCPHMRFLMIVNKTGDENVFLALDANCPANLTIVEQVPHEEIWGYYSRARLFVSTSSYEGFPNTFLQCAVSGVPVVSLAVDPEGVLSQHGCGLLADGDMDTLEQCVRNVWDNAELAAQMTSRFHAHVLQYHNQQAQVGEFESCLTEVLAGDHTSRQQPKLHCWQKFRRFIRRAGR